MSEFLLKPRICFGQDALSVLNELSARSVLLVTDQAMVKFGLAERVTALLRQHTRQTAMTASPAQAPPVWKVKSTNKTWNALFARCWSASLSNALI